MFGLQVETEFEERWKAGTVQGWEDKGAGTGQPPPTRRQPLVDLDDYDTIEELIELGPERLKEVGYPRFYAPCTLQCSQFCLQFRCILDNLYLQNIYRSPPVVHVLPKNGVVHAMAFILSVSLECCGQALAALGLKTGGTVQQRAERLYLTKVIRLSFIGSGWTLVNTGRYIWHCWLVTASLN